MKKPTNLRSFISSNLGLLILLALAKLVLHLLTNGGYGFYRDELGMLDDARHLAWGYVSYPPLTAFLMRISWDLFGQNLAWFRLAPRAGGERYHRAGGFDRRGAGRRS